MLWFLVGWPPLAFLLVLAGASAIAVRGGAVSAETVGAFVERRIPALLAVTLAVVGASLVALALGSAVVREGLVASLVSDAWPRSVAVGAAVGAAIAAVYFGALERVLRGAQARFGDYVPAGSTAALGTSVSAFFVANVVLAPAVEELWYRGVLFDALAAQLGPAGAAVAGSAAFGLFHWPGGAWYVLATGGLVGGACWALRFWGGDLAGPYAAHLVLNLIEFVVVARAARRTR